MAGCWEGFVGHCDIKLFLVVSDWLCLWYLTFENLLVARLKYNGALTFLRLGIDGHIKLCTYYENVVWVAREVIFNLFEGDSCKSEYQLPERCGNFGLCEDSQCVACPSSKIFGLELDLWAREANFLSDAKRLHCYKVEGVDHFLSKYPGAGGTATKENDCAKKCTSECLGYFYNQHIKVLDNLWSQNLEQSCQFYSRGLHQGT